MPPSVCAHTLFKVNNLCNDSLHATLFIGTDIVHFPFNGAYIRNCLALLVHIYLLLSSGLHHLLFSKHFFRLFHPDCCRYCWCLSSQGSHSVAFVHNVCSKFWSYLWSLIFRWNSRVCIVSNVEIVLIAVRCGHWVLGRSINYGCRHLTGYGGQQTVCVDWPDRPFMSGRIITLKWNLWSHPVGPYAMGWIWTK